MDFDLFGRRDGLNLIMFNEIYLKMLYWTSRGRFIFFLCQKKRKNQGTEGEFCPEEFDSHLVEDGFLRNGDKYLNFTVPKLYSVAASKFSVRLFQGISFNNTHLGSFLVSKISKGLRRVALQRMFLFLHLS